MAKTLNFVPGTKPGPVVKPGEFKFAAFALDHGHIYDMCRGLMEAGADLKWVYDQDPEKIRAFKNRFPSVQVAGSGAEVMSDTEVKLIAGAAVPSERASLGIRAMEHGKDYFTDKSPFTTMEQLLRAQAKTVETGMKYMVFYSERLAVECAVFAGQLIKEGAIGRVVNMIGTGPHRLSAVNRPDWFFQKEKYGGILCDIGSHQIEQFLYYASLKDARIVSSRVANFHNKKYPELEDFGEVSLVGDNGATQYFRVDWLCPEGAKNDGRQIILGTEGYIELRKYVDIGREATKDHLYLVNQDGEQHFSVHRQVWYPFFGQLILDCIHRTENAMTQQHAFKAAELCLLAQQLAERIE